MQDNTNLNTPDFADKGWQRMEAMLDTEMPQNRRSFFWLFLILGLLLLGTTVVVYSLNDSSQAPDDTFVSNEQYPSSISTETENSTDNSGELNSDEVIPSATNSKTTSRLSDETSLRSNAVSEDPNTFIKNSDIILSNNNNKIHTNSSSDSTSPSQSNDQIKEESKYSQPSAAVEKLSKSDGKKDDLENKINQNAWDPELGMEDEIAAVEEEKKIPLPEVSEMENLSTISSVILNPFYFDENQIVISRIEPGPELDQLFRIGLFAGLNSKNNFLRNGYQFGLDSEVMINDKLSLNASLGYQFVRKEEGNEDVFQDAAVENPEMMDQTTQLITSSRAYSILETRSYLDFSIKPRYWINERFSIAGGPFVGYLLTATNTAVSNSNYIIASEFLKNENILRKWDYGAALELRYLINRRLGISFHYQLGLQSIWQEAGSEGREIFTSGGVAQNSALIYESSAKHFNRYVGIRGHLFF